MKTRILLDKRKRYGLLRPLQRVADTLTGHTQYLFQCKCKGFFVGTASYVKQGKAKSCGCSRVSNRTPVRNKYEVALQKLRWGAARTGGRTKNLILEVAARDLERQWLNKRAYVH